MSKWTIYNRSGVAKLVASDLEYHDTWMGEEYVTVNISSATPIDLEIGDYLTYRGLTYTIYNLPTALKQARSGSSGEAFKYDNVKFSARSTELTEIRFFDIVLHDNEMHYTSMPTFQFYAETVDDFLDRIQANTDRDSGHTWIIVSPNYNRTIGRYPSGSTARAAAQLLWEETFGTDHSNPAHADVSNAKKNINISIDKQNIFDSLQHIKNSFGLNFITRERTIVVGGEGIAANHLFQYGKGNGLHQIERSADAEQQIVTKLFAYGSDKNIPTRYYADLGKTCYVNSESAITPTVTSNSVEIIFGVDVVLSKYYTKQSASFSLYNLVKLTCDNITVQGFFYDDLIHVISVSGHSDLDYIEQDYSKAVAFANAISGDTSCVIVDGINTEIWPTDHIDYSTTFLPNNMAVNVLMLPGFPYESLYNLCRYRIVDSSTPGSKKTIYEIRKTVTSAWQTLMEVEGEFPVSFSTERLRPFVMSQNILALGKKEGDIHFVEDNDDNGLKEVYPSVEGMTEDDVFNNGSSARLDEIVACETITDDGRYRTDDPDYKFPNFHITIPNLGFDLRQTAEDSGADVTISLTDGYCGGRDFKVHDIHQNQDLTWDLEVERCPDDTLSLMFPYSDSVSHGGSASSNEPYQIRTGDHYVLTGINIKETSYIWGASVEALRKAITWLLNNDYTRFTYLPKVDEIYMKRQDDIAKASQGAVQSMHDTLKAGHLMLFQDTDLNVDGSVFIDQLTIKEDGNNGIPTYDVVLRNDKQVGTMQRVQNQLNSLTSFVAGGGGGYNAQQIRSLIRAYGAELFLSKLTDDSAQGFIRLLQGLQVGEQFVTGLLGEGGVFRMDADGKTYLEADKMYVRMKAYFDSVEIREYKYTGGNRIASVAGNKAVRVEWIKIVDGQETILDQETASASSADFFRCYFRASDGEDTVRNNFVVGDMVYCHITSIAGGNDDPEQKGLNQKHFWRLCIGRNVEGTLTEDGEAWIDVSNRANETINSVTYAGYQSGSDVPAAQDSMIQLGNVNDNTRQGAIIEFVTGADAPSYQIYQGIGADSSNIYSLNSKNQVAFGYNTQTGRAYMNVYGDFRFGARPNTQGSYIAYNQQTGELQIKAHVEFTNSDTELNQLVQSHQITYGTEIAALVTKTNKMQEQIDGAIETYYMTGAPSLQVPPVVSTQEHPYDNPWLDGTETAEERTRILNNHVGDLYYDKSTGHGYRFLYDDDNNTFAWVILTDEDVTEALAKAAQAQATADGKSTIFLNNPEDQDTSKRYPTNYKKGDSWVLPSGSGEVNISNTGTERKFKKGSIITATADMVSSYNPLDWDEKVRYTDDTRVEGFINELLDGNGDTEVDMTAAIRAIRAAVNKGVTSISGGLILSNEIELRDTASTPKVWSGISGIYDSTVLGGGIGSWYGGIRLDYETLTEAQKQQGWSNLRWAKSLFRFDGSGYLAGGNITWDKDGSIAIKDITTIIGSDDTDVLNALATFNSAFHFNTQQGQSSTVLSIVPQVGFTNLKLNISGTLYDVATENWVNTNYVSKAFFRRLFKAFNGSTEVLPNDELTAIDNIKGMVGLWVDQYLSALGQNTSGGGSGGGVDLSDVWAAMAQSTNEQINLTHLTNALASALGNYSTKLETVQNIVVGTGLNVGSYVVTRADGTTFTFANIGSTVVDIEDYMTSGDVLPTGSDYTYVYDGYPVEFRFASNRSRQGVITNYIVFAVNRGILGNSGSSFPYPSYLIVYSKLSSASSYTYSDTIQWAAATKFYKSLFDGEMYLPLIGGTMANTNLVTNLNAELLDGHYSSEYMLAAENNIVTGSINMQGALTIVGSANVVTFTDSMNSVSLGLKYLNGAARLGIGNEILAYRSEIDEKIYVTSLPTASADTMIGTYVIPTGGAVSGTNQKYSEYYTVKELQVKDPSNVWKTIYYQGEAIAVYDGSYPSSPNLGDILLKNGPYDNIDVYENGGQGVGWYPHTVGDFSYYTIGNSIYYLPPWSYQWTLLSTVDSQTVYNWERIGGIGTVTRIVLGSTNYNPNSSGIVTLPAYPSTLDDIADGTTRTLSDYVKKSYNYKLPDAADARLNSIYFIPSLYPQGSNKYEEWTVVLVDQVHVNGSWVDVDYKGDALGWYPADYDAYKNMASRGDVLLHTDLPHADVIEICTTPYDESTGTDAVWEGEGIPQGTAYSVGSTTYIYLNNSWEDTYMANIRTVRRWEKIGGNSGVSKIVVGSNTYNAIGDTITLGNYVSKAGDTMSGSLTFAYQSQSAVLGLVTTGTYAGRLQVGTKPLAYLDDIPSVSGYLPLTGGTLTGTLYLKSGNRRVQFYNSSQTAAGYLAWTENNYGNYVEIYNPITSKGIWVGDMNTAAPIYFDGTNQHAIWHDGNDGTDSGLDADLLDGQHGSYYAAASALGSYLPLSGGTMTGQLNVNANVVVGTYNQGGGISNNTITVAGSITADSGNATYQTVLNASSLTFKLNNASLSTALSLVTDSNSSYQGRLQVGSNPIAYVSDIPSVSGFATTTWVGQNYLAKAGGTMTGAIVFHGSAGAGTGSYVVYSGTNLFLAANESGNKIFLESTYQNSPYFRNQNGDYAIWHEGNFTPSDYLPLTGGTLTAALNVVYNNHTVSISNNQIHFGVSNNGGEIMSANLAMETNVSSSYTGRLKVGSNHLAYLSDIPSRVSGNVPYYRVGNMSSAVAADADDMNDGWTDCSGYVANAGTTTNHGTMIQNSWNGTPFQIWIPDVGYYIYKRYHAGSIGGTWSKIYAGYADSAGSVDWTNVSGRPTNVSAFTNDSGYITTSALSDYLPLSGGTLTGNLTVKPAADSQYICIQSDRIRFGIEYGGQEIMGLNLQMYSNASDPAAGTRLNVGSKLIAYLDDIPSVSGYYLPLSGGTLTGNISVPNVIMPLLTQSSVAKNQKSFPIACWKNNDSAEGFQFVYSSELFMGGITPNQNNATFDLKTSTFWNPLTTTGYKQVWQEAFGLPNVTDMGAIIFYLRPTEYDIDSSYLDLCLAIDGDYYVRNYKVWHSGNLTNISQLNNDSGYITSSGTASACSGNSATATKLETARTIWGQSFDGTSNVNGTLLVKGFSGGYDEGIRIVGGASSWCSLFLGTADSMTGYQATMWGVAKSNVDTFVIYRGQEGASTNFFTMENNGKLTLRSTNTSNVVAEFINRSTHSGVFINSASGKNPYIQLRENSVGKAELGYSSSAGTLYLGQSGTETGIMNIDIANSRVGIGTVAPSQKLDVNGHTHISGSLYMDSVAIGDYNEGIRIANTKDDSYVTICFGVDPSVLVGTHTNQWQIGRDNSNNFFWNAGGTVVMRLLKNGNLGIGTTSPAYKLDVNGTLHASGDATFGNANVTHLWTDNVWANGGFAVYDYTTDFAVLYSSGSHVSIGTAVDSNYTLKVGGSTYINGDLYIADDKYFYLGNSYINVCDNTNFTLDFHQNNTNWSVLDWDSDGWCTMQFRDRFRLNDDNSGDDIMEYNSTNNYLYFYSKARFSTYVGINTDPDTSYRLKVNGNIYGTDLYINNSAGRISRNAPAPNVCFWEIYGNGGYAITCNGSVTATSFVNSSDARKKNIYDYNALVDVNTIAMAPAIRFTWKEGDDRNLHCGTLAQYWDAVMPECVQLGYDGYLSMQYDIIALLASISIAKKVMNHEERITELEKENERLRTEIEQLRLSNAA